MTEIPGLKLPRYFRYYKSPVKLVSAPEGQMWAWRVSMRTGGWYRDDDIIDEMLYSVRAESFSVSAAEFVQEVESYRACYLKGDGPIFALYETVNAITEARRRERRYLTPTERALVYGIRRKTFVMFEEQLQRQGDPGADPSIGQSES